MITEWVKVWDKRKGELEASFRAKEPEGYGDIVTRLLALFNEDDDIYPLPDPARVTTIDHGVYQGSIIFVVACTGYQPGVYWVTQVYYGSCSGCDTFERIRSDNEYDDDCNRIVTNKQIADYMTLALHILQQFKEI